MNEKELQTILEKHKKWLQNEKGGECADLSEMDLHSADLHGANLRYADLHDADLHYANLRDADLHYADLRHTDLHGADLRYANLHNADLRGADLCHTVLRHADLCYTDLDGANLSDADLNYANIHDAFLDVAEQYRLGTILKRKMVGYKKLRDGIVCKLEIPEGAVVFCINGSTFRTNIAKVLEGNGVSDFDDSFVYKKGKIVKVDDFNLQYNVECTSGIHFFKTKKKAKEYCF